MVSVTKFCRKLLVKLLSASHSDWFWLSSLTLRWCGGAKAIDKIRVLTAAQLCRWVSEQTIAFSHLNYELICRKNSLIRQTAQPIDPPDVVILKPLLG